MPWKPHTRRSMDWSRRSFFQRIKIIPIWSVVFLNVSWFSSPVNYIMYFFHRSCCFINTLLSQNPMIFEMIQYYPSLMFNIYNWIKRRLFVVWRQKRRKIRVFCCWCCCCFYTTPARTGAWRLQPGGGWQVSGCDVMGYGVNGTHFSMSSLISVIINVPSFNLCRYILN